MQVSIARMEYIGDGYIKTSAYKPNLFQDRADRCTRDNPVLDVVVGAYAAHGAKGVFSTQPKQIPFCSVSRNSNCSSLSVLEHSANRSLLLLKLAWYSVKIEKKDSCSIGWKIGLRNELVYGLERQLVHHFDSGGDNTSCHDA